MALTIVLVFAAVMAISLGYALPLDENASLTKTNCTYLSYTIGDVTLCSYSCGKSTCHYYCVPWRVSVDVDVFGRFWFGGNSQNIDNVEKELESRYPINVTVSCYYSSALGIRYQLSDTQAGLIAGIVSFFFALLCFTVFKAV